MRAPVALVVLVAACVEPVRLHRDGGEDVPDCETQPMADACDELSRDNVMFTWARETCSFLLGCCGTADRDALLGETLGEDVRTALFLREPAFASEPLACRRALATVLLSRFAADFQALDDGRRRFDRDAAAECVGWFRRGAQACVPGFMTLGTNEPAACGRLFPAAVAEGGTCRASADCVRATDGGASTCESESRALADGGFVWALTGRCRPLPTLGESCPLPWSECGPDAYCAVTERCERRLAVGEPCVAGLCERAAYCEVAMSPATCAVRKTNAEPCRDDLECQPTLACHPTLHVCLETSASVSPLDVEFQFCLGPHDHRVARRLEGVPTDGGL